MIKLNAVVVSEKGAISNKVRSAIMNKVNSNPAAFLNKAQKVEGKNSYALPIEDANGTIFYVNFDISVSSKSAADRAEKGKKVTTKDSEPLFDYE